MRSIERGETRSTCYVCYRPLSLCMCSCVKPITTNTKFVILMHPKEFKKTKNGTGRLTHLSLPNSQLYIDVDFTDHKAINALIDDQNNLCYVLYPGEDSIHLNSQKIELDNRQLVIFIIDSTWPCSVKILRLSHNLQRLPKLSFTHSKISQFQIKEQPKEFCLSTMESTLTILELLTTHGIEVINENALSSFLEPFLTMVQYQIQCISQTKITQKNTKRFRVREEQAIFDV
jgi:DTW domain-containing protein YfiP